jgi:hypothetical protein
MAVDGKGTLEVQELVIKAPTGRSVLQAGLSPKMDGPGSLPMPHAPVFDILSPHLRAKIMKGECKS